MKRTIIALSLISMAASLIGCTQQPQTLSATAQPSSQSSVATQSVAPDNPVATAAPVATAKSEAILTVDKASEQVDNPTGLVFYIALTHGESSGSHKNVLKNPSFPSGGGRYWPEVALVCDKGRPDCKMLHVGDAYSANVLPDSDPDAYPKGSQVANIRISYSGGSTVYRVMKHSAIFGNDNLIDRTLGNN